MEQNNYKISTITLYVIAHRNQNSVFACQETEYNKYSKYLLILFVEQCKSLYGHWFISYNVHCFIHLADDVIWLAALDCYSSFTFENNMKTMKALIRIHECVLAQIVRRMYEQETNLIHILTRW
jgi:hypothetical protein